MLSMSHRAPGYRLKSQVPPTFSAISSTPGAYPELSQPIQHVQAGESGADHESVEGCLRATRHGWPRPRSVAP